MIKTLNFEDVRQLILRYLSVHYVTSPFVVTHDRETHALLFFRLQQTGVFVLHPDNEHHFRRLVAENGLHPIKLQPGDPWPDEPIHSLKLEDDLSLNYPEFQWSWRRD